MSENNRGTHLQIANRSVPNRVNQIFRGTGFFDVNPTTDSLSDLRRLPGRSCANRYSLGSGKSVKLVPNRHAAMTVSMMPAMGVARFSTPLYVDHDF